MTCTTCGAATRLIKGECRTCYAYRRRNHRQRPEELILRLARERFEWSEYVGWVKRSLGRTA